MNDDLDLLRADWKQLTPAIPGDLHARALSLYRSQRISAAGEVCASVFLVVVSVWLLLRHPIPALVAFAMAMCLYVGVWLTYFFTIRTGSWRDAGTSVQEFVTRTRRLHEIEVRWARFARACMIALFLFLLVWSPWLVWTKWELYRAAPWRGVVGFGIAACILSLSFLWNRRKLARVLGNQASFEERAKSLSV